MEEFQQRVIQEKEELYKKCEALNSFIPKPFFLTLPIEEQVRLRMQLNAMRQYHEILVERIAEFHRSR